MKLKNKQHSRLLAEHHRRWCNCNKCPLGYKATERVIYRGKNPADVLFIGEAPGMSENVLGEPFVGPSGEVLNKLISNTLNTYTYCITNMLACAPFKANMGDVREPHPKELDACRDRLIEFVPLVNPRAIVLMGRIAKTYFPQEAPDTPVPIFYIDHPSFILRQRTHIKVNGVKETIEGKAFHQSLITLREMVEWLNEQTT